MWIPHIFLMLTYREMKGICPHGDQIGSIDVGINLTFL